MSPTPRAAGLLALTAVSALLLPDAVALLAAVAVGVATVTDAWMVRSVPLLATEMAPILSRGVPSRLVVSPTRAPHRLRIRQPSVPDLAIDPQEGEGRLDAVVVATRRGRHRLPVAATRATGPLGLGWWFHRAGEEREVVVYPDLVAARRLAAEVRLGSFRGEARRTRGPLGLGTEFESIRDYSPDDDIRQVNWKATLRTGRPMSNTYRVERDREVVCLVDCGRLMAAPLPARAGRPAMTRLDAAVDAVAAVAAVCDQLGDRIGVVAFDRAVTRKLLPRRDGADAVLRAVYDLEPVATDGVYEQAFQVVAHAKRAFVLILTDLLDESAARPLVEAMPILARHHALAVASVVDPVVEEALRLGGESEAALLRQAVAVEVTEARERAAALLASYGARVIEAAPERLSAACVAAYLSAKRRARL